MKRLLKPLIYGMVACALAWVLVLSTGSCAGACGGTGPFWQLWMILVIPGAAIDESLGLQSDLAVYVFGSISFVLISGVLLDVTFRVIGKIKARFRAIDSTPSEKTE
jgi:hypothetical protein